jgi:hypothetical protein
VTDLRTGPIPSSAPAQRVLDAEVDRFLDRLSEIEAAARAALPQIERPNAWAPWSMDTGLSRAQEDFVDAWSPQRVLDHCQAQRRLALLLQTCARTHRIDTQLVLTILELAAA